MSLDLAFIEFERILREKLYVNLEIADQREYNSDHYKLKYMNFIIAAARSFGIERIVDWDVPNVNGDIAQNCAQFMSDVDHYTMQLRISNIPRKKKTTVGLDDMSKSKIRDLVNKIKLVIEAAALPNEKAESLLSRLNAFLIQVDKARTTLQSATDIWIAICDGVGKGFEKLEPARRFIDSIAGLLGSAQDAENAARHIGQDARLRLEAPRKQLPPPETSKAFDDDIPF